MWEKVLHLGNGIIPRFPKVSFIFFLKALIICNIKYLYSRLPFFFFFCHVNRRDDWFCTLYILKVHVLIGVIGRLPSQRKGDAQIFCVTQQRSKKASRPKVAGEKEDIIWCQNTIFIKYELLQRHLEDHSRWGTDLFWLWVYVETTSSLGEDWRAGAPQMPTGVLLD